MLGDGCEKMTTVDNIPTIILCGGRGTRITPSSQTLPKPLVPIGQRPILWHIMKMYATHGYSDFVLALGWLGDEIRKFFLNYEAFTRDFTVELGKSNRISFQGRRDDEDWRVACIETGIDSLTGTRVRIAAQHAVGDTVMVTYGDGVGDIDVNALVDFHRREGRLATVTVVRPPGRFGELILNDTRVIEFAEKPQTTLGAISGGFMVFEREAIERYIPADSDVMLEREPLSALAADGQLSAYQHPGFWQPMDTPREQELLETLWRSGDAPWKVWK